MATITRVQPQPFRLQWPWTADQVEKTDQMFEILFKQTRVLKDSVQTASSTVPIVATVLDVRTSVSDAFVAQNTTAATAAVPVQNSPAIHLKGLAWNTTSLISQQADFQIYNEPISANPVRNTFSIDNILNGVRTTVFSLDGKNLWLGQNGVNQTAANSGVFRGGDGTATSPTFGFVNSGGGGSIGFYTPAANDMNLVCNSANQILWGVGLWRNSAALGMNWASTTDPNLALSDLGWTRFAAGKIILSKAETAAGGVLLDASTTAILNFRNVTDTGDADIQAGNINATVLYKAGGTAGVTQASSIPSLITTKGGIVTAFTAVSEQTTTSTGTQNNFALTAGATVLRCNNATDVTFTGFAAGVDGQQLVIQSVGAGQVNFAHQNAGSAAANRLTNYVTSGITPLAPGVGSALFTYDATSATWRLTQHTQGAYIAQPYNAGDYTADVSTWTVDSGDLTLYSWYLSGNMLNIALTVATTSVGAGNTRLFVLIPNSWTINVGLNGTGWCNDGGTGQDIVPQVSPALSTTKIGLLKTSVTNWTLSTNTTSASFSLAFPIQ